MGVPYSRKTIIRFMGDGVLSRQDLLEEGHSECAFEVACPLLLSSLALLSVHQELCSTSSVLVPRPWTETVSSNRQFPFEVVLSGVCGIKSGCHTH